MEDLFFRTRMRSFFFIFILMSFSARFLLAQETDYPRLELARFGLYATAYLQDPGSTSYSGLPLFSPAYRLNNKFSLLTDLGATYLHTPETQFWAIYAAERLEYKFVPNLAMDLSVGVQHWTKEVGISPMAGVGLSYHFKSSFIPFLETMRGALEYVRVQDFPTLQALIGFEFRLCSDREKVVAVQESKQVPVAMPAPTPIKTSEVKMTSEGLKLTLDSSRIRFAHNKSALAKSGQEYLSALAKVFKSFNEQWSEISISGHTDNVGTSAKNDELSLSRAHTVAEIMKQQGIQPNKIKVRGAGSKEPVETNDTPQGRSHNRRVELSVTADSKNAKELAEKLQAVNRSYKTEDKP